MVSLNLERERKQRGHKDKQFTSTLHANRELCRCVSWPERCVHTVTLEILGIVDHSVCSLAPGPLLPLPFSYSLHGRLWTSCTWPWGGSSRRLSLFTLAISPCNLVNHVASRQHRGVPHTVIHKANPFIFHTIEHLSHPMPCQDNWAPFVPSFWVGVSCPTPSLILAYVLALACCSWARAVSFVLSPKTNESIVVMWNVG